VARPFFAYMLLCADKSYYVGHTDELEHRLSQHEKGTGSIYTSTRLPVCLVWSEEFPTRDEALAAELRIKKWSRAKKEALIAGDFSALRLAAKKTDWAGYRRRRNQPGR